jgi:hypothetical protein
LIDVESLLLVRVDCELLVQVQIRIILKLFHLFVFVIVFGNWQELRRCVLHYFLDIIQILCINIFGITPLVHVLNCNLVVFKMVVI